MNKKEIKIYLEQLRSDSEKVMALFRTNNPDINIISARYSEQKTFFITLNKELEKKETQNLLSSDDEKYLFPAIHEVAQHCVARIGSKNKKELSSSIYDCSDYLTYYINQID